MTRKSAAILKTAVTRPDWQLYNDDINLEAQIGSVCISLKILALHNNLRLYSPNFSSIEMYLGAVQFLAFNWQDMNLGDHTQLSDIITRLLILLSNLKSKTLRCQD